MCNLKRESKLVSLSQRDIDMLSLNITEDDLINDRSKVTEKLFCAALCRQSTDIIATVLKDYSPRLFSRS